MSFGGSSAPAAQPITAVDKDPLPANPVTDPKGLANFLAAGLGSDTQHNKAAAGGFQLGQQIALGTGTTRNTSLFGPKALTPNR